MWRTCVYIPVLLFGFGDPERSRTGRYSARTQRALAGAGPRGLGQLAGAALRRAWDWTVYENWGLIMQFR
jgi:hypothetical protein